MVPREHKLLCPDTNRSTYCLCNHRWCCYAFRTSFKTGPHLWPCHPPHVSYNLFSWLRSLILYALSGCGLMIHSRGANASDAEIVMSQILQGMGGGLAAVSAQVSAQASVPHADVAMVTAVVLLVTEIGNAIGGAIGTRLCLLITSIVANSLYLLAGAIWTALMPDKLEKYLPFLTDEQRALLYGSLYLAAANPRGDPIREGVILGKLSP